MKVLVTGAAGYIGSHLCKVLKDRGYSVTGLDNYHYGPGNDVSKYCDHFYTTNVRSDLRHVVNDFDTVVHLAGLISVEESVANPVDYYRTNIQGTVNVLEYFDCSHFLFASTSAVPDLASPYAISKLAAEQSIQQLAPENHTIFRFFNVSGTNGEHHQLGPSTHLIRVAAEVAAGKRSAINIYGGDYITPDGTCVRDYVHVVDLANAIAAAIEQGPSNQIENLGSGTGYSVLEVVHAMEKVTNQTLTKNFVQPRPGDAVSCVADNLSNLIKPTKTLEQMCADQYNLEVGK